MRGGVVRAISFAEDPQNGNYSTLDKQGNAVLPWVFDDIELNIDGDTAYARVTQDGAIGLIRLPDGEVVFPLQKDVTSLIVLNGTVCGNKLDSAGNSQQVYFELDGTPLDAVEGRSRVNALHSEPEYTASYDITDILNGFHNDNTYTSVVAELDHDGNGIIKGDVWGQVTENYGVLTMPDETIAILHFPTEAKIVPSLGNFVKVNTYTPGQFGDVAEGQWYSDSIRTVYELGLMKGTRDDVFDLKGSITVGSALATAARLHKIYTTGDGDFNQGAVWYDVYVAYCKDNDIFTADFDDYNRPATRAEFAAILFSVLPKDGPELAYISELYPPDVDSEGLYSAAIGRLYGAGVLTGSDERGTFHPDATIDRCSAATIIARMAIPDLRVEGPELIFEETAY